MVVVHSIPPRAKAPWFRRDSKKLGAPGVPVAEVLGQAFLHGRGGDVMLLGVRDFLLSLPPPSQFLRFADLVSPDRPALCP